MCGWLCSNKVLSTKAGGWLDFACGPRFCFFFAHPHPPLNIPYPNVSQNAYFKILVGLLKEELSNLRNAIYTHSILLLEIHSTNERKGNEAQSRLVSILPPSALSLPYTIKRYQ